MLAHRLSSCATEVPSRLRTEYMDARLLGDNAMWGRYANGKGDTPLSGAGARC
jgi:hypothetical protein